MKRAFSLVEIVAVMALLALLLGLALWGVGGARDRELAEKVRLDLGRIDSAKAAWRADHPQEVFPAADPERFTVLRPYLKAGLQEVTSLSQLEPLPAGVVSYLINAETVPAGARNSSGKSCNRQTGAWE